MAFGRNRRGCPPIGSETDRHGCLLRDCRSYVADIIPLGDETDEKSGRRSGFLWPIPKAVFRLSLPGLFAVSARIGDVAIGLFAIWMVERIDRDPAFATSRAFVRFHLAGLLDFAIA